MPNQVKPIRDTAWIELNAFINGQETGDVKSVISALNKAAEFYPSYGHADLSDFRELSPLFERFFAYDNKHFYIYKAISNPNKIGYLSRKQYYKFKMKRKSWARRGIAGRQFHNLVNEFLSENGTMASPYKFLKRAFKENPENTRCLSRYFPLEEDEKTTRNESKLIELCDAMMKLNTGVEIKDASIQDCYDLNFLGSNINGSGTRYCTNSCMYGKKVGSFYEAFGVKGKMVYYRGQPVGRFLIWDVGENKKYIDRLYVRGEYANEVLAKIDSDFDDEHYLKYPFLRTDTNAGHIFIKLNSLDSLLKNPDTPYIDTFAYLYRNIKTKEYFLSNKCSANLFPDFKYIDTLHTTSTRNRMKVCPHCKQVYWTGDTDTRGFLTPNKHKLYCTGYQPRTRELKAYIEIFRKNADKLGERYDENNESIFEV